jgi:hypothetical protein
MHFFSLPFFIILLGLKNVISWSKIFFELIGLHLLILALVIFNILCGSLLYLELQRHQELKVLLTEKEALLEKHRVFWKQILQEFSTHKTAKEAVVVLEKTN